MFSLYSSYDDRYEPDMLAFSGCDYGGGEKEKSELGALRKRWKTLHVSRNSFYKQCPKYQEKKLNFVGNAEREPR